MSRRIRDFRTEEELSKFVNSIAWSESEDDGDFSSDDSDYDPDFDFDATFRNENFEDDEQIAHLHGENEAMEVADVQNNAAVDVSYVEMGNADSDNPIIEPNTETNQGKK